MKREDIKEEMKEDDYYISISSEQEPDSECKHFWCDLANLAIPVAIVVGILYVIASRLT